ncbi:hypothetical protein RRG08_007915 [Elysia crispata]|uniref:Uncharacterized protein n=1 Tax=Elysia crispata TaxID=231223 RepID=A0AAE0ZR29_9GAST|nr:hypothetical protein RRG08_007915 [Elysia crispata]
MYGHTLEPIRASEINEFRQDWLLSALAGFVRFLIELHGRSPDRDRDYIQIKSLEDDARPLVQWSRALVSRHSPVTQGRPWARLCSLVRDIAFVITGSPYSSSHTSTGPLGDKRTGRSGHSLIVPAVQWLTRQNLSMIGRTIA